MALDITRGLFGIELPSDSLSADQAQALAFAQLTPDQAIRASGMMSGKMMGRGIAELGRAGLGAVTGVDVRNPDEKRQSAQMRVLQAIKEGNINPEDPEAYLPLVAKAFQEEGLVEDALKAATALRGLQVQKAKMTVEESKAKADMLEALTKAAKEKREGSPADAAREFAKTGKYTSESISEFLKTGDVSSLKNIPGWKTVETSEGMYVMPENVTADSAVAQKIRVGSSTKGLEGREKAKAREDLQVLLAENLKPGERVGDMLIRLETGDPLTRNKIYALAKEVHGADNVKQALDTLENPTEGVLKLMTYVPRMQEEVARFNQKWGNRPSPVTVNSLKGALEIVRSTEPNQAISSTIILNAISDPVMREYITDAMSTFYPDVRLQTGAAISAAEWRTAFEQMVPYADDTPSSIKSKKERRVQYMQNHYDTLNATPAGRRFLARREIAADKATDAKAKREEIIKKAQSFTTGAELQAYMRTLTKDQRAILQKWIDSEED